MILGTLTSFKLRHATLDLNDIAAAVALPIFRIWTAGDSRKTMNGDPLDGVYESSYCVFKVVTEEETLPAAISAVDVALRAAANAYPVLKSVEIEKSLYCTLMEEGETVDPASLALLVAWDIGLEIEGGNGMPAPT